MLAKRLRITLISGGKVQRQDLIMALVMYLPAFVTLVLLGTYPMYYVVLLALQRRALLGRTASWVGLENLVAILNSDRVFMAFRNDVVFTLSSVAGQFALGLAVALLLHQTFWGRNVFRGSLIFSYIFPIAAAVLVWRFMLSDSVGIIHHLIQRWQLPIPNTWFASTRTAMASVVLVNVWKFFPFMVINLLARLQTIELALYDAAKVDGANSWQSFRYITLPMLMPVVIIVVLLRTIWTFNSWEMIALLTGGGPLYSTLTLPILVYDTMFSEFSMGRAAAIALMMMVILSIVIFFYIRLYERSEEVLR